MPEDNRGNPQRKRDGGLLIVIEGIDGSGKSTLAKGLYEHLNQKGLSCIHTFEPTNGPWGKRLREGFLKKVRPSAREELEMFIKDRMEHVKKVILPALKNGQIVICDRYYLSTMAYQGARGLDVDKIRQENEAFAPRPDLVILLEIEPEKAARRIKHGRGESLNNMEEIDYLKKVSNIFSRMDQPFIKRLDASCPEKQLLEKAIELVEPLIAM